MPKKEIRPKKSLKKDKTKAIPAKKTSLKESKVSSSKNKKQIKTIKPKIVKTNKSYSKKTSSSNVDGSIVLEKIYKTNEIDYKVTIPKKVEQGKMSIDTEQMLKDLEELGRIDPSMSSSDIKKTKKDFNFVFEKLPKSPMHKFINEKNSLYVKLAAIFFSIILVFFLSLIYFLNTKVVIDVELKDGVISNTTKQLFEISSPKTNFSDYTVISLTKDVDVSDVYNVSEKYVNSDFAEGKIRITNNTSSSRSLVQKTRFISDVTGDLYRVKDDVVIPANSSIEADIIADKKEYKGEDSNVRFTIPGLASKEIRELIFGTSITRIASNSIAKKVVNQNDVDSASLKLDTLLKKKAVDAFAGSIDLTNFIMLQDSIAPSSGSKSVNAVIGSEVNSISISGKTQFTAIFVNKNKLNEYIRNIILKDYKGSGFLNFDDKTLSVSLVKSDYINKQAVLSISMDSLVDYKIDAFLSKKDIAGMNLKDLNNYITERDFAKKVDITFYPFWNKRVPQIIDNIIIRVK